jgi:hypothetical protein
VKSPILALAVFAVLGGLPISLRLHAQANDPGSSPGTKAAPPRPTSQADPGRGGGSMATVFAELYRRPTTQVLWAGEIARIAAGESLAVITALKLKDPARPGAIGMGFRLELSRTGSAVRREIYLGGIETRMFTVGVVMLERVGPSGAAPAANGYATSPEFLDGERGLLLGAHYLEANERGAALGLRGEEDWLRFPGRTLQDFAAAFQAGWKELGKRPFAHDEGWNPGPSRYQPTNPIGVQDRSLNFYLIETPPVSRPPVDGPGQSPGAGSSDRPGSLPDASVFAWAEVGRLEAGGARAVVSVVRPRPNGPAEGRRPGVRIQLSQEDSWQRDTIDLGPAELAVEFKGIKAIIEGWPRHLELMAARRINPPSGYSYFGAAEFWRPSLELLNVAAFQRGNDESGVALASFTSGNGYYHFPGKSADDLLQVLEKAARELGNPFAGP